MDRYQNQIREYPLTLRPAPAGRAAASLPPLCEARSGTPRGHAPLSIPTASSPLRGAARRRPTSPVWIVGCCDTFAIAPSAINAAAHNAARLVVRRARLVYGESRCCEIHQTHLQQGPLQPAPGRLPRPAYCCSLLQ